MVLWSPAWHLKGFDADAATVKLGENGAGGGPVKIITFAEFACANNEGMCSAVAKKRRRS